MSEKMYSKDFKIGEFHGNALKLLTAKVFKNHRRYT